MGYRGNLRGQGRGVNINILLMYKITKNNKKNLYSKEICFLCYVRSSVYVNI